MGAVATRIAGALEPTVVRLGVAIATTEPFVTGATPLANTGVVVGSEAPCIFGAALPDPAPISKRAALVPTTTRTMALRNCLPITIPPSASRPQQLLG